MYHFNYKQKFSFQDRFNETSKVLSIYPERVPLICERSRSASSDCPEINKNKYLVPRDLTIGQFIYVIRKRLNITAEKGLFLFIDNKIMPSSLMFGQIYDHSKNADGYIYVTYCYENTFG